MNLHLVVKSTTKCMLLFIIYSFEATLTLKNLVKLCESKNLHIKLQLNLLNVNTMKK